MKAIVEHIRNASEAIAIAQSPEELKSITDADCAGVIWYRQPKRSIEDWISTLPPEQLPSVRLVLRPETVRVAVVAACEISEMPDCAERTQLIDDIAALADTFSAIMKPPLLRLRLDRVTTNACRKFHVDALSARLICTYRGAATQFAIRDNRAEPAHIFDAPTGSPIILRGTLWPEQPSTGLLHRSPPIEGTGETRLVLVLDPIFEEQEDV
ncbi:DUF1826 domain-containing protein [Phaeobacter sp. C3_T13_0]|uniref:DUF1826 domain-containing protein n=1 Tax=Phaeobacter cretensis TaxID=3342641 RepID=UPI0039BCE60E